MASAAVAGLVLAAGLSQRLGSPKALVELGGATLLTWACRHLIKAGCSPVVVVINEHLRPQPNTLPPNVITVVNPEPEKGRTGSLQVGLQRLRSLNVHVGRAVMAPVDRPGWRPSLVRSLLDNGGSACPVGQHGRGHPVVLDEDAIEAVLAANADAPLRDLVAFHPVSVVAPWLNLNIDTPQQLEELRTNEHALLAYYAQGEGI
jgi:molybdenum cofactor cytidylyltransferase